jgi:hypothetical protein
MAVALEEFTEWRDSVEVRLGKLEAVSEKHGERFDRDEQLFGAMDRDLGSLHAEFRAQRSMLQALHDTQSDHTARLTRLEDGVQGLNAKVGGLDVRVQSLDVRVQSLDVRVQHLEVGMREVQAGVQTIIGLLDRSLDGGNESGDS